MADTQSTSSTGTGRPRRIAVGFHAGGSLPLRLAEDKLTDLRQAITSGGGGWHEVESEDGTVLLNLAQVIYLRVESDEHRIGF